MGNSFSCNCREDDDREFVGRTAELQRERNVTRAAALPLGFKLAESQDQVAATQQHRTDLDLCYSPSATEDVSSSACSNGNDQLPLGFQCVDQHRAPVEQSVIMGPESVLQDSWTTDMTWSTGLTDALPLGLSLPGERVHEVDSEVALRPASLRTMMEAEQLTMPVL